jgi:L-lactate dehydrogenase complex protein LldE
MRVGLFIPCYIDQFYPDVGMATVHLLERLGVKVDFPEQQSCCGQPMANMGCEAATAPLAEKFLSIFSGYEAVVCPSGSCTAMVRHHYQPYLKGREGFASFRKRVFELSEFLTDVLQVGRLEGEFPHRVGIHQSCHGLRELRLGESSERVAPPFAKPRSLLVNLRGIELVSLERTDECCGFGGTFAVGEEAVSCMMGDDRLADHRQAGTEILTGVDMSCLMHLEGLLRRQAEPMRVMHLAQILDESGADRA